MKTLLQLLLFVACFVIVHGGHIQKVVGVKDANGQCICSVQLSHVSFPVRKVEQLQGDFYNLTDHLQNMLNQISSYHAVVTDARENLTIQQGAINHAKDLGAHIDLGFTTLIKDIYVLVSMAQNLSRNATSTESKYLIDKLLKEINGIAGTVIRMGKDDQKNIITVQREIETLRKKLEACEEGFGVTPGSGDITPGKTDFGTCKHGVLQSVSSPVLVKQNWKGGRFKAGAWGKDFALGTRLKDHYWVFPLNKDERTLETFRLYSSYNKLLLYSPIREYSLNVTSKKECDGCGQGGGVIFYNGSFFYNCLDSRALCRADPFNMRVSKMELSDQDPASFNNWFSYKDAKYQDMDMAGDEKGLWMIHGSTLSNGNAVIRKVNPYSLKVGTPWITTQAKNLLTNTFMICGILYATKRLNSTHEEIFYYYDTSKSREGNLKIEIEKVMPTVQSLNYNPNDEKLYMFNDGFLVYYNTVFRNQAGRKGGKFLAIGQDSDSKGGQDVMEKGAQVAADQKDLSQREKDAKLEEGQDAAGLVRQEAVGKGNQFAATEGGESVTQKESQDSVSKNED
ncbi:olfactomedin-like [Paroedura picta]|uniref:olfactomedin-like n=1 Tax=Paroedura picta TaxID=143630 RepID=UPI004057C2A6